MKWELNKIFVEGISFSLLYNLVERYSPVVMLVEFEINVLENLLPSDFIILKLLQFKSLIKKFNNAWLLFTNIV